MIIIDTNSISARAFFGTHYNTSTFDEPLFVNAFIKSLLSTLRLLSVLSKQVIFCIDSPSWRKRIFPDYKDNRKALKDTVPYKQYVHSLEDVCSEMKRSLPVLVIRKEPYEADDLLAYFALSRADKKERTTLVTNDGDMYQLYGEYTQIYNPSEDKMIKLAKPEEYLQVLICTGDKSDNIPSLSPKNADGKPRFQFGEKTIPKYIEWGKPCGLNDAFWSKLTPEEKEKFVKDYDRNERLIDLSMSPVHGEDLTIPEPCRYKSLAVEKFFRTYINSMYESQGREIQELMQHFGGV